MTAIRYRMLVVEDEKAVRFGLSKFLQAEGYDVQEADSCAAAVQAFQAFPPDLVILDHVLPDGSSLDLLPKLRQVDPAVPLVVLTAYGSIDLAVQAVKEGAEQFLTKPLELSTLAVVLRRILENARNRKGQLVRKSLRARSEIDPFVGESAAIRELADNARRVPGSDSPILIRGETGTGKGVLARWLHDHSPRSEEPFVDLNCAALGGVFLETELFGHEKGAFTGAADSKQGLLEVAHRGTVFLDELGDMSPEVQPRLLKVLEEKRFRRLGDVKDRQVDIRLIAATHQDLLGLVREKKFRNDLYFRISTLPLVVPPLRQRPEDIPLLARRILAGIGAEMGRGEIGLSEDAVTALQSYNWPGNIRELHNVLERAVLLGRGHVLQPGDLALETAALGAKASADTHLTLREVEARHIERVLTEEGGRVESAAKRLGIPRSSLYQKIKVLGIVVSKV